MAIPGERSDEAPGELRGTKDVELGERCPLADPLRGGMGENHQQHDVRVLRTAFCAGGDCRVVKPLFEVGSVMDLNSGIAVSGGHAPSDDRAGGP